MGKNVEANAWGEKLKKEHPNSPAAKHRLSAAERQQPYLLLMDGDTDLILNVFSAPLQIELPPKK